MSRDRDETDDDPLDACMSIGFGELFRPDARGAGAADSVLSDLHGGFGKFTVGEEIGRGGVGIVVEGHDNELGRRVALKLLRDRYADNPSIVQRFVEEAQIGGQLEHPGIVSVHELGVCEGRPYFAMRLVEGKTFAALLEARLGNGASAKARAERSEERQRFLKMFEQICHAVAYAHARGVVHRDLKPGNVVVGAFGEVQVIDWGMCKVLGQPEPAPDRSHEPRDVSTIRSRDDSTRSAVGSVMGTWQYMPPEQAHGLVHLMDRRVDVFALGAMLCEVLTGAPPYVGTIDEIRVISRSCDLDAAQARLRTAGVDDALVDLALDCLQKEPDNRPADASAVRERISDYLASVEKRAEAARIKAAEDRVRVKAIRRQLALAFVLIAAVAAGLIVSLVLWRSSQKNLDRFNLVSYVVKLRQARATESSVYPPWPNRSRAIETWLADRGRPLAAALPTLVKARDDLRAIALPWTDEERKAHRAELAPKLDEYEEEIRMLEQRKDGKIRAGFGRTKERLALDLADARKRLAGIECRRDVRAEFSFERDQDRFLHDALAEVVRELERFVSESGALPRVEQALRWSRQVQARSIDAHADAWQRATESIAASDKYGGLRIAPQLGLVPLRENPSTGLWEFAHLATSHDGVLPTANADGKYEISRQDGIVFVLIPGGRAKLGAQKDEPLAPHYDQQATPGDGPVISIELDPFFLGKHEITKAQWMRMTRRADPSHFRPGEKYVSRPPNESVQIFTWTNPVENVSWQDCTEALQRLGLTLPTDAQWEYACRAGTQTPWYTGTQARSLRGAANLFDRSVAKFGQSGFDNAVIDGFLAHAPVASLRPNPWGLYDILGNVCEWCMDVYGGWARQHRDGDGLRMVGILEYRSHRGGAYNFRSRDVRSASRRRAAPTVRESNLGVRAVRRLR